MALVLAGCGSAHRPAHGTTPVPARPVPAAASGSDPARAAAVRAAQSIIADAPVPPHATLVDRAPIALLDQPSSIPAAQLVRETRFWTAPGTVDSAIGFLTARAPHGMSKTGTGSAGGPNVPDNESLEFGAGESRTLEYDVVAFRGGVAVRADAVVLWAPTRAPADRVVLPVASVDVVVRRQNPQLHKSAPTVRRTLTGGPAAALAKLVNGLSRQVPGTTNCPAVMVGEQWSDELVFHDAGPVVHVLDELSGCGGITFTVTGRPPVYLAGSIDAAVLRDLGLPANYGS